MENPTRRRVLVAGLTGTTLGLIGGRAVSAGTTPTDPDSTDPASTDPDSTDPASSEPEAGPPISEPPDQPTSADIPLLAFGQSMELTARDLYDVSIAAGVDDQTILLIRENHQAYAQVLAGILGVQAPGTRDDSLFDEAADSFDDTDLTALAGAAYDVESTMVATYTEMLRTLVGRNGARLVASILTVEAQQCAVLADMAGKGDDLDAMFDNDAAPLPVPTSSGG